MKLPPNPLIYEILEAAGKARSKTEKIKILKDHERVMFIVSGDLE